MPSSFLFLLILFLALGIRIAVATGGLAMNWPDEHFQTLEPAHWIVNGFGTLTWEWFYGIRPWSVPAFFLPILYPLKWVGFHGGAMAIYACRVYMVVLSVWAIWKSLKLTDTLKFSSPVRAIFFWHLCFTPALVGWSVTTSSDQLALILIWASMPAVFARFYTTKKDDLLILGALVALPLFIRFQLLPWIGSFFLAFCYLRRLDIKRDVRVIMWPVLGGGIVFTLYGLMDWVTWGAPFHSLIENFRWNILKGVAGSMGTKPFYAFLPMIFKDLSPVLSSLIGLTIIFRAVLHIRGAQRVHPLEGVLYFASFMHLLSHSFISHKEVRYMLPIYPSLLLCHSVVLGWVFSKVIDLGLGRLLEKHKNFSGGSLSLSASMLLVVCLGSFVPVYNASTANHRFPFPDQSKIELAIAMAENAKPQKNFCVYLIDNHQAWTRGQMLMARPTEFIEIKSKDLKSKKLDKCRFAILPTSRLTTFEMNVKGAWQVMPDARQSGYVGITRL